MYAWLIFLHILGVFGFLLAHGASASIAFALRQERHPERVRALLMLSGNSYRVMYPSLIVVVLTGILAGVQGQWWRFGWIWLSLALLILLIAAMSFMGSNLYGAARKVAGLPYFERGKVRPPLPAGDEAEVGKYLSRVNPLWLTLLGFGGLGLITWLMMFKPF